ncbi:VOC family protein [Kamptonema cortianum]|nr:VOC family protein [Geitlerinema splendidum]MDK3156881.1 VOC family protein [Kamptonema cortianum]
MESIIFLPTEDLGRTKAFYEGVLGLDLRLDQGTCHIYRITGAAHIGFCTGLKSISPADSVIVTIVADNVDEIHARLVQQGVQVDDMPRVNEKFKIYHFFAKDPNGYRVEVQSFLDPRW